jgi:phosphohistidine phosphatase
MRTLFLLRHAKSSWADASLDDHDRPLNRRGERASAAMGAWLAAREGCPQRVLCSSARRARETATRVLAPVEPGPALEVMPELYLASAEEMLARLRALGDDRERVMLVGHEPGMRDLALWLAGDGDETALKRLAAKFPTGAVAILAFGSDRWSEVGPGGGTLTEFVTPRELD